jgi:hypothetical protein
MPQHPFPDPGPDHEEPDRSPLPPAAEGDGPAEQGLYLCRPPEQLTLAGFAQNGEADTMAPGPLLATVVDTVVGPDGQGLAGCSDDQLMGIISAARRQQARDEWISMAAIAEYAARHAGSRPADEFAPVELGYELHLTPQSAAEQMQYSAAVAVRLPATFAALAAGQIHPVHLRIIEDETRILSDEDAAQADVFLAEAAPGMTFGELRSAAHKLILKLDPEAVRKRKEAAKRETHVRRFREESGNAGMVARELPSAEVLASWQHVEQRALDLRAAGMPGSLQDLRVQAYLDLLQERDSRDQIASPSPPVPSSPIKTVAPTIPARPARMTLPTVAPRMTLPTAAARTALPTAAARTVAVLVPLPGRTRRPGRASRLWSRSPSPWPRTRAGPRPRVKPTGSACWTVTRLATWPPRQPAIPAPGGASPP